MRNRLFAVLAVLLLIAACAPAQETETAEEPETGMEEQAEAEPMDDEAAVDAVRAEYVRLYNAGDAEALGDLFTEDAVTLFADGGVNEGRAAIVAGHEQVLAGDPTAQIQADEIMVRGDRAVQRGSYQIEMQPAEGETASFSGHYITELRKVDGEWKIEAVISNYDGEPPAGLPAGTLPDSPPEDMADSPVAELTAAYEEHFNAGDAAATAELYTEDAWAALANAPLAQGRSEVQERLAQRVEAGSPQLTIHTIDAVDMGDGWYVAGGWYEMAGDMPQAGNWMTVVTTVDGSQKIHWMVSNAVPGPGGDM